MTAGADVLIVGAGPAALFSVFELGLFGIRCHLIDVLDRPGGQCAELYADKPIYDVPAIASLTAQELIDRLSEQIAPFAPRFTFNCLATGLDRLPDGGFRVTTAGGAAFDARVVVIAAGGGAFLPKRPSGTGEPGALTMKPGPVAEWGLPMRDGQFVVDAGRFETAEPGVFAVGDAAFYPGKLRLILSGFHEAALMAQAVRRLLKPAERAVLQYTTTSTGLQRKLGVAGGS